MSGLIIGLGAVTVIDLHGFLGRRSIYWTEATIRTHKITKPLIWTGTILFAIGVLLTNTIQDYEYINISMLLLLTMILNGLFLSFYVSPYLLKQELEQIKLLPVRLQMFITVSFIISFISWWSQVIIFLINSVD